MSFPVTFDGDRNDHDHIRVRRSGGGTSDAIVRNMTMASEVTGIDWIVRITVSHHNLSGVDDMVDRLADAVAPTRCTPYFAPVGGDRQRTAFTGRSAPPHYARRQAAPG